MKTLLTTIAVVLISAPTYGDDTVRIATFNCEFLNLRKLHSKFGHAAAHWRFLITSTRMKPNFRNWRMST